MDRRYIHITHTKNSRIKMAPTLDHVVELIMNRLENLSNITNYIFKYSVTNDVSEALIECIDTNIEGKVITSSHITYKIVSKLPVSFIYGKLYTNNRKYWSDNFNIKRNMSPYMIPDSTAVKRAIIIEEDMNDDNELHELCSMICNDKPVESIRMIETEGNVVDIISESMNAVEVWSDSYLTSNMIERNKEEIDRLFQVLQAFYLNDGLRKFKNKLVEQDSKGFGKKRDKKNNDAMYIPKELFLGESLVSQNIIDKKSMHMKVVVARKVREIQNGSSTSRDINIRTDMLMNILNAKYMNEILFEKELYEQIMSHDEKSIIEFSKKLDSHRKMIQLGLEYIVKTYIEHFKNNIKAVDLIGEESKKVVIKQDHVSKFCTLLGIDTK